MTKSIPDLIQQAWREQQVPLIDGILFGTGVLYRVEYSSFTVRGVRGVSARVCAHDPSRLEELEDLVAVDELAAHDDPSQDVRYSCGEGGFGGDGFVACTRLTTGDLEWVGFFQQSNPFVDILVEADRVETTNNHGHVWTFLRSNPLDVSVR